MTTIDLGSDQQRRYIDKLSKQWKLTPATLGYRISRGKWIPAKHLMYISSRVAAGIHRGNARIIISAPPRHGKSELTSIHTPTWVLEEFPEFKIILAGYGADLATGFSRRVRDVFTDEQNFDLLNTRVRRDTSRVEAFLTESGGGMYAVGLGGPITGRGANVLLIDDYIKEIKEALSPAYRDYIWNWFVTTAFTRLEPGGSCIIIATRWHSDDLIGRILTNLSHENWEYIELPAIAEEGDIIGRAVGEPLFEQRYPVERLVELRKTLGTIFFGALFQQKPVDETKKIASSSWLKTIDFIPMTERIHLKRLRCWDLAATQDGGDYTVGTLQSYNPHTGNLYIENVVRRQLSPGQVEAIVRNIALIDGEDVAVGIEQEPGSAGKALVEHYKKRVLPEFKVYGTPTNKNKIVRAQPFLAAAEAGSVFIVNGGWNNAYIKEFDAFPGGDNDDQVDTSAAGYTLLSGKKTYSASWGRKSVKDKSAIKGQYRQANARLALSTTDTPTRRGRATFGRR